MPVDIQQQIETPFSRCNSLAVARSVGTLFGIAGRSTAEDALGESTQVNLTLIP
jgi:hypothetical protein